MGMGDTQGKYGHMTRQNPCSPTEKYHWLDLFRFAAALIVVVVHVRGASFVAYGALPAEQQNLLVAFFYFITRIGNEAVVAFFV